MMKSRPNVKGIGGNKGHRVAATVHKARETAAEVNGAEALKMHVRGMSYRAIGEKLGVSHVTIKNYIDKEMGEIKAASAGDRERARSIQTERLEIALAAVIPYLEGKIGAIETVSERTNGAPRIVTVEEYTATMKAADTTSKLIERLCKLNGWDAPAKVEQSGPDGGAIPVLHSFTPERQAALAERARALILALPAQPQEVAMSGEN